MIDRVAASAHLSELLGTKYRRRWTIHVRRRRSEGLNYAAIAQVVALHLWDTGVKPDTDLDLPRQLRDRIRQSLLGEQLSEETLAWIAGAFEFSDADSTTLRDLLDGRTPPPDETGVTFTLRQPPIPLVQPQRHRTTALFSRYYIGTDHALNRIDTSQVIMALEDGVDGFAYSPHDTLTGVEVIAGGILVAHHTSAPGFVGLEFKLDRPLFNGQFASLQYSAFFGPRSTLCTEIRRAARKRTENIDMRVIFEGAAPRRAWWCAWDSYSGGNEVRTAPVPASRRVDLHRFTTHAEEAVFGFRWEW